MYSRLDNHTCSRSIIRSSRGGHQDAAAVAAVTATTGSAAERGLYFLQYKYVPDIMVRRDFSRPAHLQYVTEAKSEGRVIVGGACPAPIIADGDMPPRDWISAVIVFQATDENDAAEWASAFTTNDPYVLNGLVLGWDVSKWNVVVGDL
jgi:uncharacterized protein YciI